MNIRQKAALEDGQLVSVGGLVTDITDLEFQRQWFRRGRKDALADIEGVDFSGVLSRRTELEVASARRQYLAGRDSVSDEDMHALKALQFERAEAEGLAAFATDPAGARQISNDLREQIIAMELDITCFLTDVQLYGYAHDDASARK